MEETAMRFFKVRSRSSRGEKSALDMVEKSPFYEPGALTPDICFLYLK